MSKMKCRCGNLMSDVDEASNKPFEGELLNDVDFEHIVDEISKEIAALVNANSEEQRYEWIAKHFNTKKPKTPNKKYEFYYDYQNNEELLSDYIYSSFLNSMRSVWECANCNRIWLQTMPSENNYDSFNADEYRNGQRVLSPNLSDSD